MIVSTNVMLTEKKAGYTVKAEHMQQAITSQPTARGTLYGCTAEDDAFTLPQLNDALEVAAAEVPGAHRYQFQAADKASVIDKGKGMRLVLCTLNRMTVDHYDTLYMRKNKPPMCFADADAETLLAQDSGWQHAIVVNKGFFYCKNQSLQIGNNTPLHERLRKLPVRHLGIRKKRGAAARGEVYSGGRNSSHYIRVHKKCFKLVRA